MEKYEAVMDVKEDGWETVPDEVKQGSILECREWHGIPTLMHNNKAVCDKDSAMFKYYFKLV